MEQIMTTTLLLALPNFETFLRPCIRVETNALAFLSHFWLQLVWPALPLDFRRNTAKKGVLIKTKHFFLLGRRDTKCQPTNRQRQDTLKR